MDSVESQKLYAEMAINGHNVESVQLDRGAPMRDYKGFVMILSLKN